MKNQTRLSVLCFTDVLCGYAYLGHARVEQLKSDFGAEIELSCHFVSIYGDTERRFARRGITGAEFSAKSAQVFSQYDHVEVHPDVFRDWAPTSSIPAHLYLRAIKLLEDDGVLADNGKVSAFDRFVWAVRVAFFRDLRDISSRSVLDEIGRELEIPVGKVAEAIDNGRAFAELAHDAELAKQHGVTMSPTLVLNEGRQLIQGNVGYRVIEANMRELLSNRAPNMSWC